MRINIIVNEATYASGVFTSARTFARMLEEEEGIKVELNGSLRGHFDIFHFHSATPGDFFRLRALKKAGHRVIAHGHTTPEDFYDSFFQTHTSLAIATVRRFLRSFYALPDTVIAVSPYNRDVLIRNGVAAERLVVVPNGIFLNQISPSEERAKKFRNHFRIPEIAPIALCVGIWLPRKGIYDFAATADLCPGVCFLWAGKIYPPGMLARSFSMWKKLRSANKTANMRFLNYVPDIIGAFSAADVFFYPTQEENQGIALLEAIGYKIPCVVRDIGVFDWLSHGTDCLKGKAPEEFKDNILSLLNDEPKRSELSTSAYSKVKQFDMRNIVKQLVAVYNRAIDLTT
ncbi:MAG: glycosyltransferase family 4 protein [Candidatus Bathyarchaeota archaeon]|nr:MAG: glycosyltransferase family 4 protein [Candidatus Bathyarchaeota archaeon]